MKTAPTFASRRALGAFALVLALAVTATAARGDETLRWKFTKGQKLSYVLTQTTLTKAEVMGQKSESTTIQAMDLTWVVKDVDGNGVASMEQTIDRIVFTSKGGPIGEVTFDTSKNDKLEGPLAIMGAIFNALTGSPFGLKMNARGEVSDVQVPPKVLDALKNAGPAAQMGGELFSEKGLRELTSQSTIILPKEAVAKGFKWNTTKNINFPGGTMNLDNGYTYEGPSGPLEKIGVEVKLDLKPADNSPVQINIAKQDAKGSFLFDNKDGVLRSSELTQKLQIKTAFMGNGSVVDIETTAKMNPAQTTGTK